MTTGESLTEAKAEFARRYRSWCLTESEAEWKRDFRYVRMVRNSVTSVFLDYMGTLTSEQKKECISVLSKRLNAETTLNSRESEIYQTYQNYFSVPHEVSGQIVSASRVPPSQLALQERYLSSGLTKDETRKALHKNLKRIAGPGLGQLTVDKPSQLVYEIRVENRTILTSLEMFGHSQLRYTHVVRSLPGKPQSRISGGIAILGWTGILAYTDWSCLLPEDSEGTAESVLEICSHFFEEARGLLQDLDNPR